ncbi:MAG: hypothetical protein BGO69_09000 [Bacteroidetes bacterium 46-16]|mgnify:CR=1 FL=1|nr:MAG: hypothetical protein BGO69_09000 [Bacteroidetes bacterium 46-16]
MNFSIKAALSATIILISASCGNGNNKNNETAQDATSAINMDDVAIIKPSITNADQLLTKQIDGIYNSYLQVQSALAADQFSKASVAANELNTVLSDFKDSTMPENQKQAYETHISAIRESANKIVNSKNIEQQRISFEPLSTHVFDLLKSFGSNKPVYETHCSMAFDNKGASWLSDQPVIRNPYYGNKMLECGEVMSVIKK